MNILPKKRWHVRTKDNIARVRKDEAKALEEQKEEQRRIELAEKEARINFLRKSVAATSSASSTVTNDDKVNRAGAEEKHINLFADYEEGLTQVARQNKDHIEEKKEEQEKYEKQIGLLTYLGQDTNEALKLRSWYEKPPERSIAEDEIDNKKGEIDLDRKIRYDPMNLFIKENDRNSKTSIESSSEISNSRNLKSSSKIQSILADLDSLRKSKKKESKDKKKKKDKKHKHKKSKDHTDRKREKYLKEKLKEEKLKILRQERLQREAAERQRQENLLNPKPKESEILQKSSLGHPKQKYNSQFNPELAKQNFM